MARFGSVITAMVTPFREDHAVDYDGAQELATYLLDHGYHGFVGIEYEGNRLSEEEGVRATKRLLERIRDEFSTRRRANPFDDGN